jgi:hypothetical protein
MRWLYGLIGLVAAGCAGDAAGDDPRMGSGSSGSGASSSGGGGKGGSGSTGTPGTDEFGNPIGGPTPPDPMSFQPVAGTGCQVGMFCPSTDPDPTDCGSLRLETDVEVTRTPGNLLVIFDQSGSMDQPWGMGGSKLQSAQNALVQALTPLQDDLTVGALFFPTAACIPFFAPPPMGSVQPIDGPQQIPFQPGPQFLTAWQAHWGNRPPGDNIGTPMQEAFDRADVAIKGATLTGQTLVVAFTDGEPNCFPYDDGVGAMPATTITGIPTMTEPMHAAEWLSTSMIKTYMVGLPGANGVQILNDVAVSGGTMQYIVPDDPTQLEMKLREVVEETIKSGFNSCSISLNPAANPPEKLLMLVEEGGMLQNVPHEAGADGAGWTINDDGTHVEITGALCDDAMGGRFTAITFEYGCPDVPPPPTLPPVI